MSRSCYRCGRDVGDLEQVGRRDACLGCGGDLHCCRNCRFYEPGYHNDCREPQAERQVDKQQGNFCEYFSFAQSRQATAVGADDARAKLGALFGARKRQ
jgi:hypothetical protein